MCPIDVSIGPIEIESIIHPQTKHDMITASSASKVLLVKDDVGSKIDAYGTKYGRGGNVRSDGLCELDYHAHEEGGEDLREKKGAVQNGEV